MIHPLLPACLLMLTAGCHEGKTGKEEDAAKNTYEKQVNRVAVMVVNRVFFQKEIVCNGKLNALQKSELRFKVGGELQHLYVRNGNAVAGGQTIAALDQFEYQQKLEQARSEVKMASIKLQDELLSYGGARMRKDSVPSSIYEGAAIRSGYVSANRDLKTAEFNLTGTVLKAPFGGKIANLKKRVHEQTSPGDAFCTIINDHEFEVEFQILESEIGDIAVNNTVKVVPFAIDAMYSGLISEVNPQVEESGLVSVKALIRNNGKLWEGMNVKVIIEKKVPNQFVVPKEAVVLRQNQEVLFRYSKGRAIWTYVKTDLENSTSYTVVPHPEKGGSIHPGDTVIISDNLNLAHESEVVLKSLN